MHVRVNKVTRGSKIHSYTQLVQSYRNEKGRTSTKVIANLGKLPPQTAENLKTALRASRDGKAVVIAAETAGISDATKVICNLKYLPLAVYRQMWNDWGLDELLREMIAQPNSTIPIEHILCALTLQRATEPRSKLYATKWLAQTALPETLGIPLANFNNTRIHRALDTLESITPQLQQRLPALYQAKDVAFAMTFMDVTDTYFEGVGCDLAERTQTKEGHANKKAIGITLQINQDGYPLRWQVNAGKMKDHIAMGALIEEVAQLDWMKETPLVVDRAMGRHQSLQRMRRCGIHFVTAVPSNMIASHTPAPLWEPFADIAIDQSTPRCEAIATVRERAQQCKELQRLDDCLFVMELGKEYPTIEVSDTPSRRGRRSDMAAKLRLARQMKEFADNGSRVRHKQIARHFGVSLVQVSQHLALLGLAPEIQDRILSADKALITQKQAHNLLKHDLAVQQKLFSAYLGETTLPSPLSLPAVARLVAYFNPAMFVDQRIRAAQHCQELDHFIREFNRELANTTRSRKESTTRRHIERELEKKHYAEAFDITLTPLNIPLPSGKLVKSYQCALRRNEQRWNQLRKYDGFVLLVTHPDMAQSAEAIAKMYRAKDAIEKDFESIKSVIKLRPIYHQKDEKVKAHVTLCIIALLLQRTLERKLQKANMGFTAQACHDILHTCHLNLLKAMPGVNHIYSITRPNDAQKEILKSLGLEHLSEDERLSRAITGRIVPTE